MGAPRICLERASNIWVDRARAYYVIINDEPRGRIRRGEKVTFDVDPGAQAVELRVDWCRSRVVKFDLESDEEALLGCSPCNPLLIPYAITIGRDSYIRLALVKPNSP